MSRQITLSEPIYSELFLNHAFHTTIPVAENKTMAIGPIENLPDDIALLITISNTTNEAAISVYGKVFEAFFF